MIIHDDHEDAGPLISQFYNHRAAHACSDEEPAHSPLKAGFFSPEHQNSFNSGAPWLFMVEYDLAV